MFEWPMEWLMIFQICKCKFKTNLSNYTKVIKNITFKNWNNFVTMLFFFTNVYPKQG